MILTLWTARKRKLDDLFTDASREDSQLMSVNTNNTPCRASGIRGIYNMGATCYMNVILQSLMQNPLLRNFHLGDGHRSSECTRKNCVACAMDEMFQAFHAQPDTVGYSAHNMLACFWMSKRKAYEELASNKEQDAHEFFQFLTEELHEINSNAHKQALEDGAPSPKPARPDAGCNCIVHQTFYGRTQSTITCQGCKEVRTSVQQFMDLSLGLDVLSKKKSIKTTGLSVKRCLEAEYKQAERCEYTCHKCGTKEAKKLSSIKSLPNVLSLQLKVGLLWSYIEKHSLTQLAALQAIQRLCFQDRDQGLFPPQARYVPLHKSSARSRSQTRSRCGQRLHIRTSKCSGSCR